VVARATFYPIDGQKRVAVVPALSTTPKAPRLRFDSLSTFAHHGAWFWSLYQVTSGFDPASDRSTRPSKQEGYPSDARRGTYNVQYRILHATGLLAAPRSKSDRSWIRDFSPPVRPHTSDACPIPRRGAFGFPPKIRGIRESSSGRGRRSRTGARTRVRMDVFDLRFAIRRAALVLCSLHLS